MEAVSLGQELSRVELTQMDKPKYLCISMEAASEQNEWMQETLQRRKERIQWLGTIGGHKPVEHKEYYKVSKITTRMRGRMAMDLAMLRGYLLSSFPIYSFPSDMSTSFISTVFPYLSHCGLSLLGIFWHFLPLDLIPICLTKWSQNEKEKDL